MIRYKIATLAKQTGKLQRGGEIVLSPIADGLGTRRAYLAELRRLLRSIAVAVNNTVLPVYEFDRLQAQRHDSAILVRDVSEGTFNRLRAIVAELVGVSSQTVRRILDLEAIRHTDTFMDEARKAIGIDLSAVVQQSDLDDYMRAAIARNVSLIKSLSDDTVKRVEQAVTTNAIAGNSSKYLRGVLTDQFGVMDSRARLISRDQTSKFNSDLNRIRQEQAGIDSYDWATAHDERVRPLHRGLDGHRYSWGQPTGAEDGLPPGQPIQCRCIARAVIEWEGMEAKRVPAPAPAAPVAVTSTPKIQAAVAQMNAIPRTDEQAGFGTPDWFDNRRYNFGTAENPRWVQGKEETVNGLVDRARKLAQSETGIEFEIARERRATIVIGPPAAGKSTIANSIAVRRRAAISDVDDAKLVIPEFKGGIGANAVHEESALLGGDTLDQLIRSGDNLVIPKVGAKLSGMEKLREQLQTAGYEVDLVLMDVEPDVAMGRMLKRFDRTGRLINPDYFKEVADKPKQTYIDAVKGGNFDGYSAVRSDDGVPARVYEAKGKKSSLARGEQIEPGGTIRADRRNGSGSRRKRR